MAKRHKVQELPLLGPAVWLALAGVVALALLASGCSLKSAQITHVGLQAADLASTYAAERSGNGVEANPFAPASWPARIAIKGGVTAAAVWISRQLEKEHPRSAKWFLFTVNTLLGAVVINNVRIAYPQEE